MKTGRRPVLAAGLTSLVGAAVPRTARAQTLPALLPKDRNPAAAGVVEDALVQRGFEIFDVDHEKRWCNRVDQLDGLTLGCGHWLQGELAAVLTDLSAWQGGLVRARLEERLVEFYGQFPQCWRRASGVRSSLPTAETVHGVLARTLDASGFVVRYTFNCDKDGRSYCLVSSPSFFREHCSGDKDWIGSALSYAMRDEILVRWQADYWRRDVIEPARSVARAMGIDDQAWVMALASIRSSASSLPATIQHQAKADTISTTRRKSQLRQYWSWNTPRGGARGTPEALRSWRNLVLWQAYCHRAGRVRGRSRAYWAAYLAADWRVLPMRGGVPVERDDHNLDPTNVAWIQKS